MGVQYPSASHASAKPLLYLLYLSYITAIQAGDDLKGMSVLGDGNSAVIEKLQAAGAVLYTLYFGDHRSPALYFILYTLVAVEALFAEEACGQKYLVIHTLYCML